MAERISHTDLAWIAAIVDCKALYLQKRNKQRATPQLVLQVDTRDVQIIQRLCRHTEVLPDDKRTPQKPFLQRACKDHCPEPHIHHEDNWSLPPTARWAVTGIAAGIVLHNLRPFMVTWDEDVAIFQKESLAQATYAGRGYGQTLASIKRLMALGWILPPETLDHLIPADVPGGRATPLTLSCGHQRPQGTMSKGRSWCQQCNNYKRIVKVAS